MDCRNLQTQLDDYLDGDLPAEAVAHIEAHIAECGDCARRIKQAQALGRALARLPVEGPDAGFLEQALENAMQAPREKKTSQQRRYVGAIAAALAIATVAGFLLRDIGTETSSGTAGVPAVAMAIEETRTINLVFASAMPLNDVELSVTLPPGVQLANYPGQQQVNWSTELQAGRNVLPLELIAFGGDGGELVATLKGDGKEKVFTVNIAVEMG